MKRFVLIFLVSLMPMVSFGQKSKKGDDAAPQFEVAPYMFEIRGEGSVAMVGYDYDKEPNPESTELVIPAEVTFEGKSYKVTTIEGYKKNAHIYSSYFRNNINITSVIIPPYVTTIGTAAFCELNLEQVTIPESVTTIGSSAFRYCENLRSVEILSPKIFTEYASFGFCSNLCVVTIHSDYLKMDENTFFIYKDMGKPRFNLSEIKVKAATRPYVTIADNKYNPKPLITIIDEPQQAASNATYAAAQQPVSAPAPQPAAAATPTPPQIVSDVDQNIPTTTLKNENTFVVIIANENYTTESAVDFALNDGRVFKSYCESTLGIPSENIRFVENGTLGSIGAGIGWLKKVLDVYKQDANAIFYYSGHGIPNEATGDAFLLPTDCQGSDFQYAYSINRLYSELGEAGAGSVTYFIDACFSGTHRKGDMMVAARGVAIKAKSGVLSGNSVAFAAASGDETAFAFNEKGHGMFTYFLLKKLQETKGQVSYGELANYIQQNVKQKSIVISPRLQSPNTIASTSANENWQSWKLIK
ncbi:MAG: leucine-rich repeat protein [Rikenellaceae bacterium]